MIFFPHFIFFFMESMTWIRNFCQLHWLNVDTIDICRDESDICKLHFESRLGVTLLVLVCLYFATFFFSVGVPSLLEMYNTGPSTVA